VHQAIGVHSPSGNLAVFGILIILEIGHNFIVEVFQLTHQGEGDLLILARGRIELMDQVEHLFHLGRDFVGLFGLLGALRLAAIAWTNEGGHVRGNPSSTITAPAPYQIPNCLKDLVMVDLLELTGSTISAAEWLSMSQPSVRRRQRALARDLQLESSPQAPPGQRYGDTPWLELIRRGVNLHRLSRGMLRIGPPPGQDSPLGRLAGVEWIALSAAPYGHWPNFLRAELLDAVVMAAEVEAVEQPWDAYALPSGRGEPVMVAVRPDATVRELLEALGS